MEQKSISWEQMKKTFPDEWLVITDFRLDAVGDIAEGIVQGHSKEMDIIVNCPIQSKQSFSCYTGESTFAGLRSHLQK